MVVTELLASVKGVVMRDGTATIVPTCAAPIPTATTANKAADTVRMKNLVTLSLENVLTAVRTGGVEPIVKQCARPTRMEVTVATNVVIVTKVNRVTWSRALVHQAVPGDGWVRSALKPAQRDSMATNAKISVPTARETVHATP